MVCTISTKSRNISLSFGSASVLGICHSLSSSATGKTTVEVRGTFLPCHREFKGNETDGATEHGDARSAKCSRRIYLSLKITNVGQIKCPDQLILVDHLFDTYTKSISRLLNPIVIKVKQEQISKVFDLKYIQLVNGEAKETIHPPKGNTRRCRRSIPCGSLMNMPKKSQRKSICCSCESHSSQQNSNCGRENIECPEQEKNVFPPAQCNVESHQQCGKLQLNVPSLCSQNIVPFSPDSDSHDMSNPKYPPQVKNLCNGDHAMERGINGDESDSSWKAVGESEQFSLLPIKSRGIYESFARSSDGENVGKSADIERINGYERAAEYLRRNINSNVSDNRGMFSVNREVRSVDRNIDYDQVYYDGPIRVKEDSFGDKDESSQHAMNMKEAEIYVRGGDASILGEHGTQIDEKDISKGHALADDIQRSSLHKPKEASRNGAYEHQELISGKPVKRGRGVKFRNRILRHCNTSPDLKKVMHCMTYSEIWYEVHRLDNFTFRHVISLQAFEKNNNATGNKLWLDNTKGEIIRMGSSNTDYNETFNYRILGIQEDQISLNKDTDRLLIPRQNSEGKNHSEAFHDLGNPAEFLVVSEDLIATNGSECNKVGVSMEAFLCQKGRCSAEPGFCLKNQPLALWRKDKGRKECGLKGDHTLENFGNLSTNAYQVEGDRKTIAFDFYGKHVSQVDITVPVYSDYIVRKGLPSRITSIVADSSCPDRMLLTVSVGNLGLASANFTVRLGRCIPPIHAGNSIKSTSQYFPESKSMCVSPMNQVDFTIALKSEICENKLHCIVEVLNDNKMVVAARRVLIKKGERCICLWHCQCHCINTILKLLCRVMPESAVYAAGLKGTVPVFLPMKTYGYIIVFENDDMYQHLLFFMCCMIIILLLLGICKALLGITFWRSIWIWGLPYYCGPKAIPYYREPELADREVQFDVDGYPVHPDTKKRTVRIYNRWVELFLNIFIFLIFPLIAVVWWPVCWCCSLVHRNVIGYRWVFRASKTRDGSSQNTSVTSTAPSEDPEGGSKSLYSDGKSSIESKRSSDSERGSGDSSSSSKGKMREQGEKKEGGDEQGYRRNGKNDDSETRSFSSRSHSQIVEIGSDPVPKLGQSQENEKLPSMSMGNLSSFGSRFSIETYDGIADELEVSDVDYVLKQLRRSSTEIQKSRERMSTVRGPLPSRAMANSVRGEILEDIDSSPRLESSSEDSIPGDLIGPVSGLEGGDMNRSGSVTDEVKPPLPPPLNRKKSLSLDAGSGRSSYGLTGLLTVAPATVECSFQHREHSPTRVTGQMGRGNKSDRADDVQTVGSFSEVLTQDSLEVVAQVKETKPKGAAEEELVERLHVKHSIFRNMMKPMGGVVFPTSQPYSIRGYFLKTDNGYKFIPPTPLWQYWTLDEAGIRMDPLMPPKNLFAAEFERDYLSARNVAEAGDLSEFPLSTCINVQYQNFDSPTSSNSMTKTGQLSD